MNLPQVTLCCLTGVNYKRKEHQEALWKSQEGIRFGEVKLIEIEQVKDIDSWNKAVIYDLPKYVNTTHCIFIHHDGFIINPELWKDEWLGYDYAGSPFPLPSDSYSYRDVHNHIIRVGNSVSLRSKKLLDMASKLEWRSYYGNTNEDGFIAVHNRHILEEQGCKFMPFSEAIHFGKEHEIEENKNIKTFLYHHVDR